MMPLKLCVAAILLGLCLASFSVSSHAQTEPEIPPSEQVGEFLSDGNNWKWPPSQDPEAQQRQMYEVLAIWCGDTYTEAVADANQKAAQFDQLRKERDARYKECMECTIEKASREVTLHRECEKQQMIHNSSFLREKKVIQAECEAKQKQLRADVNACEVRQKGWVEAACDRDAVIAQASCVEDNGRLDAQLKACEQKVKETDSGRCAQLELDAVHFEEEKKAWEQERERLAEDVAECRPAKAQAEARLKDVLADGTIASLESTVTWLQVLLLIMLLLVMAASAAALFLYFQEGRGVGVGGGMAVGWPLVQTALKLRLLSAEQAKDELQAAFEGGSGYGVSIILTTTSEAEAGPPLVFLLVPVNVASSRRFALFGGGGDYTGYVERAQEFVSNMMPKARLVVVLYEYGGCVFTETTLQSLRLTADKVADEAVPKDASFPKHQDIVVLWLCNPDGLCAADSEGESELSFTIKSQPWAEYLLGRSGRWGPLPPQ